MKPIKKRVARARPRRSLRLVAEFIEASRRERRRKRPKKHHRKQMGIEA